MMQKMFSVRDSKAMAFLQPFFSSANGSAIRAFIDAVNDKSTPLAKHPEDYILYEIGCFDDTTGEIIGLTPLKMLGVGSDFVVRDMPQGGPGLKMSEMDDLVAEIQNGKK